MADSPLNGADGPIGITVKFDGTKANDTLMFERLEIDWRLGAIPHARVYVALDPQQSGEADASWSQVGTKIEISGFYGSELKQRLFEGIVAASKLCSDAEVGMQVELICKDATEALNGLPAPRHVQDMRDSDVLRTILENAELEADVTETGDAARDQLFAATTAWALLERLAARNGHVIVVDAGTVRIAPPDLGAAAKLSLTYGVDVLAIDVGIDATQMRTSATVQAWNAAQQSVVIGAHDTLSEQPFGNTSPQAIADVFGPRTIRTDLGAVRPEAALTARAAVALAQANTSVLRGTVRYPGSGKARPGDTLDIETGSARFSGKAYVSGVSHLIESGRWETTAQLGLPPAPEVSAPEAMAGLQIGVVTALPEAADSAQRMRVRVPMLGDDASAEVWARFAAPYASDGAGFQFLPEMGDEVVLGFLAADPNAPVILGALHNTKAPRPLEATAENATKLLRTRSGLTLAFDEDKKAVTLCTPDGRKITLDDEAACLSMEDANGSHLTMNEAGITLSAEGDLTLSAKGKITMTSDQDVSVSGANLALEADMGLTAKGGTSAELSTGGQTTINGAIVMIN